MRGPKAGVSSPRRNLLCAYCNILDLWQTVRVAAVLTLFIEVIQTDGGVVCCEADLLLCVGAQAYGRTVHFADKCVPQTCIHPVWIQYGKEAHT